MKKTYGFFGGSFDPIHFGHLNLAIEAKEQVGLDKVIFSPAFCSPHKKERPPKASAIERRKMVELAIMGIEGFSLSNWESERKEYSYTIDALHFLHKKESFQGEEIGWRLILAEDAALHFHEWKRVKDLVVLAPPIVGKMRGSKEEKQIYPNPEIGQILQKNSIEIPTFSISSTQIRERCRKKLFCGHLVPGKVLDFIYKSDLYSS